MLKPLRSPEQYRDWPHRAFTLVSINPTTISAPLRLNPAVLYSIVSLSLSLSLSLSPGYLIMTDEWFSEYVYEVVVDKKFVTAEVADVMEQTAVVLPAWDPMGALA